MLTSLDFTCNKIECCLRHVCLLLSKVLQLIYYLAKMSLSRSMYEDIEGRDPGKLQHTQVNRSLEKVLLDRIYLYSPLSHFFVSSTYEQYDDIRPHATWSSSSPR